MKFREGKAVPFIKQLGSSWKKTIEILDSEAFRKVASNALLVAFDLEGHHISVNEIGLAALDLATTHQLIPFDGVDLDGFQANNAVEAHRIQISEHARHVHPAKYGSHTVISKVDITRTVHDILMPLKRSGTPLVLLGYSMINEFIWMGEYCPSFLSFFDYWVDIQDIVCPSTTYHPGLRRLMAEMARPAPAAIGRNHRAVVDAIGTLAIASRVLTHANISIPEIKPPQVEMLSQSTKKWRRRTFRAKITAAGGEALPACISNPKELAQRFCHYDLLAVLIEARKLFGGRSYEWWLSFKTRADLHAFCQDLDDSVLDGQRLEVEKVFAPWVEFAEKAGKLIG